MSRVCVFGPRLAALALSGVLVACSSAPPREQPIRSIESPIEQVTQAFGDEIALRAIAQVGTAYRYGGADLKGFDCSGLVFFIHRELGLTVPRTAADQYSASRPVNVHALAPGDLLFFRTTNTKRITHVGIYAGEGRFVHAPQTGRTIELRDLRDDYYGPRLVGAGRLHDDAT
ncbi:MAG: C40 family peptidase [Candidatus Obscuribacterales bacterium]|nr:C40 family peptidase [Steroidobacteraceae bacterium]